MKSHLMNKKNMAQSCRVSATAFDKWGVTPVERKGREAFYDVASVIDNRVSGVEFDGSKDITLTAAHVAAFARRATDTYADADGGVPWNAESGAYNVPRSGDSYILVNFYTGVGSCRTLQMKAHYRNGGLFYRSSRDGYGFEEDWAEVYTSKNLPPES